MLRRLLAISVIGTALLVGAVLADEPRAGAAHEEHDFGTKVIVVVTHPQSAQAPPGGGYLETAKIRKVGDRSFIVGKAVDLGGLSTQPRGTTVWFPLSEVLQITEYENVEALRKAIAEQTEGTRRGR